jgi:hypothetical protein
LIVITAGRVSVSCAHAEIRRLLEHVTAFDLKVIGFKSSLAIQSVHRARWRGKGTAMKTRILTVYLGRVAMSITASALLASPAAVWAHRGEGHEHPVPASANTTQAPATGGLNRPALLGPQSISDTPSMHANDAAELFALRAGDVYRASSDGAVCPGEFPVPCVLRVQPKNSLSTRTMITDVAVRSISIAVDEEHVYWGDYGFGVGGEQIMRVPLSANGLGRSDAEPVAARQWTTATLTDVVVDDTYIYWSENKSTAPTSGHIFRRLKAGGPAQSLASFSTPVRRLRADGAGGVIYTVGVFIFPNILARSFVNSGVPTTTFSSYALVEAFDLDGSFVYFASRAGSSNLTLRKLPRASFETDSAAVMTTIPDTASSTSSGVSGVSVDESNLFWVLWRSDGTNRTGTLNRLSLSGGGTADTLASTVLDVATGLVSDGIDVYWRNPNPVNGFFGAIYRIRANALAVTLGDLRVTGYEATQAVQTAANEIPLIARKQTVVRVYLAGEAGGAGAWTRVTGRLRSSDSGITYFPATPNIVAHPGGSNRNRSDDSLTFVLGPLDTAIGSRNYVVDVFQYGRADANAANNRLSFTLRFSDVPDVKLYGVIAARQHVSEAMPAIPAARWTDFELHVQFTQNAFATARVQLLPVPGVGARPPSDSPFVNEQAIEDWSSRTLARLPSGSLLNRMVGVPGASGFATGDGISRQENGRTAGLKPGSTMAQEVAHTLGLWWHTFDPMPYPRPADSSVGPETGYKTTWHDIPALGFGIGPIAPTNSGTLNTPLTVDYMGYDVNNTNWTSPFTYCTLLAAISANAVTCPASVEGGVATVDGSCFRRAGLSACAGGSQSHRERRYVRAVRDHPPQRRHHQLHTRFDLPARTARWTGRIQQLHIRHQRLHASGRSGPRASIPTYSAAPFRPKPHPPLQRCDAAGRAAGQRRHADGWLGDAGARHDDERRATRKLVVERRRWRRAAACDRIQSGWRRALVPAARGAVGHAGRYQRRRDPRINRRIAAHRGQRRRA